MPRHAPLPKDLKQWDKLVDALFKLDEANPYLSETVEPEPPAKRPPTKRPTK